MPRPEPNVVPEEAAIVARSFVFERRASALINPHDVVGEMVELGCGTGFPSDIRGKRLKTWALQVLRRLRKRGWLGEPTPEGWPTTELLRECEEAAALGKRARPGRQVRPARAAAAPTPPPPAPSDSEHWEYVVQDWVFHHREREFGVVELAVALVQRGYGTGELNERLDGARDLVERELANLDEAGLIQFDAEEELWQPTEVLRTWPTANRR